MSKKVITCPYCFKKFKNTDVEYQCENIETSVDGTEKCPREVDQRFNDHWGNVVMSRHFSKAGRFLYSAIPQSLPNVISAVTRVPVLSVLTVIIGFLPR